MEIPRLNQVAAHVNSGVLASAKIGVKKPDDIVIVQAVRTPITRAYKGGFKDTGAEYLLGTVLRGVVSRAKIDPVLIEDICVGNVCPPGGGATLARMAAYYAGFPDATTVQTVNRQCASGLQAVVNIANQIQSGIIEIGIGAGVESMSEFYGSKHKKIPDTISEEVLAYQMAADCLIPMGLNSETIAKKFGISREEQDIFSAFSHQRAAKAQREGLFDEEIIPVKTKVLNKNGTQDEVVISHDEGIRQNTTQGILAKLKPAFSEDGCTTAGNSSQISDGAAAVLLMKRSKAQELGLHIQGKFITSAAAGVQPQFMGIGPVYAVPMAAKKAGCSVKEIDIVEFNEAFASLTVYCIKKLGLDIKKVNPKGGAIAFGHPLGCTGARQVSTLLTELKRQDKRIGCVTMCAAGGCGMAAIFESEH